MTVDSTYYESGEVKPGIDKSRKYVIVVLCGDGEEIHFVTDSPLDSSVTEWGKRKTKLRMFDKQGDVKLTRDITKASCYESFNVFGEGNFRLRRLICGLLKAMCKMGGDDADRTAIMIYANAERLIKYRNALVTEIGDPAKLMPDDEGLWETFLESLYNKMKRYAAFKPLVPSDIDESTDVDEH